MPASDRLWLWVKIDDEALRGSEADVAVALIEGLGLEPPAVGRSPAGGARSPWRTTAPGQRGAPRAVALAAGARVDDTLLLGFSVHGDVAVEVEARARPCGTRRKSPSTDVTLFP